MSQRLEHLTRLLESSPNDSFLLFALAKEHEGLHNQRDALTFYLRLLESDPGYVGLYYHLGKLYEAQQDIEKAIMTYKNGIKVSKKAGDRHAMSELSAALLDLEDPE